MEGFGASRESGFVGTIFLGASDGLDVVFSDDSGVLFSWATGVTARTSGRLYSQSHPSGVNIKPRNMTTENAVNRKRL